MENIMKSRPIRIKKRPQAMTVSENVEIMSNGQKILLEKGDKIIVEALSHDYMLNAEKNQSDIAALRGPIDPETGDMDITDSLANHERFADAIPEIDGIIAHLEYFKQNPQLLQGKNGQVIFGIKDMLHRLENQ